MGKTVLHLSLIFAVSPGIALVPVAQAKPARASVLPARTTSAEALNRKLRERLEQLIEVAGGNRTSGSEGNARAYQWIRSQAALRAKEWQIIDFEFMPDVEYGIRHVKDEYEKWLSATEKTPQSKRARQILDQWTARLAKLRGLKARNLILRKDGSDPRRKNEPLLLVAHYDTLVEQYEPYEIKPEAPAPGADDNGAAVVALLDVAEALRRLKPARPVEIVFTDHGETEGFLGALAYARHLAESGAKAQAIVIEMIGGSTPPKPEIHFFSRSQGHPAWTEDQKLVTGLIKAFRKASKYRTLNELNNHDRSDNLAFWKNHLPAAVISQDWRDQFSRYRFHASHDVPADLDYDFIREVRNGLVAAVPMLAQ